MYAIRRSAASATLALWCLHAEVTIRFYDSSTGQPVEGVSATLALADGDRSEGESDAQGLVTFSEAKAGAQRLQIAKAGYVDLLDLAGRGHIIAATDGSPISVILTASAVVTGVIRDSKGEPLEGGKVFAVVRRREGAATRLIRSGKAARSDDRGAYRLYGLAPGWYGVAVVPAGEPGATAFPPAYSSFFELKPGDEIGDFNLTVKTSDAAIISGTISGTRQESARLAGVALASIGELPSPVAGLLSESDGSFTIRNVPPGDYRLLAWTPPAGRDPGGPMPEEPRAASRMISVSGGELKIDLALQPLLTIHGSISADGGGCSGEKQIAFESIDGWPEVWPPVVTVNGDHFTASGLPAGRYRLSAAGLDDSCRLVSVRVDDHATPDGVISIDGQNRLALVFTSASGEISGLVIGTDGRAATGIVLLAQAGGVGIMQTAPIDSAGRYRLRKIVAGEYLLTARKSLDSTSFLDAIESSPSSARRVTVESGKSIACDLNVAEN